MKKTLTIIILFTCFISGSLMSQNMNHDSLRRVAFSRDSLKQDSLAYVEKVINTAKRDGRRLRLTPVQRQRFDADKKNSNSDFFKPGIYTASDTTMLKDSVYVKAFRIAACNQALKYRKRKPGHYILVTGIVLVSSAVIFAFTLGLLFSSGVLKVGD